MSIVNQKSENSPNHGSCTHRRRHRRCLHCHNSKRAKSDRTDTGEKTIQTIRKINRIGNGQHHKDNKRIIKPSRPVKRNRSSRDRNRGAVSILNK
ncbi:hypothetical protein D3C75_1201080 [compost metagenome]